jgi:membrane fusion protein (multidrug efflux system)
MSKMEPEVMEEAVRIEAASVDARNKQKRKKLFIALGATVLTAGLCYGVYSVVYASRFVSTDNAYTAAETAQVTPAINGIVREVLVSDTSAVKQGQVLVLLDDVDAKLALAQADAELGRAVRRVRGYVANDESLAAQIRARASEQTRAAAQVTSAQADFERAQVDLSRRQALAESGSVSGDELTRAQNAFETAKANLAASQASAALSQANRVAAIGSREANAVLIANSTEDTNPEVTLARARRDQAQVNLERTVIRAPVDGVVAKRTVQVGQQVQAGSPMLSVVPVSTLHVDANFKEVQLEHVKIGQPVEVRSDLYGKSVKYHGVVTGLAGGTGSTFATIPAQNATGNWIKVVQRVPVRIEINPTELKARPLQIGLSMEATIDTRAGVN